MPIKQGGEAKVELGDELVVRLVVTSDRDYEFLELADHRPSITEPVDVLSGWRYGDGAAWYVAIRDAATQLFFERLPRGTHVFDVFAAGGPPGHGVERLREDPEPLRPRVQRPLREREPRGEVKSGTGADFPFPQARCEALATTNQKKETVNAIAERK